MRPLLVGALLVAASAPAAAGDWSLHVVGTAEAGWTDNLFSAPRDPPPSAPSREADFYTQLTPGGLFTYETPRTVHEVLYEIDVNLYAVHSEAHSLTQRLGLRSFFLTSPLTEMTLAATISQGSTNTFSTGTTAATGELTILPSGRADFRGADFGEGFSWQSSREVRITQHTQARAFETVDHTSNTRSTGASAGGGVGADRAWRADSIGFTMGGDFVRLKQEGPGGPISTTHQVIAQTALSWHRDLSMRWSTAVDAGVTGIVPLDASNATVVQPTVGAAISYVPEWGSAGVQVRRSVAPNLYIAQNTITDSASLHAGLPLPWLTKDPREPTLSISGTLGFARTSILDAGTGDPVTTFTIGTADVAIGYQFRPSQVLGLRYQFLVQDGNEDDMIQVYGYTRHTVLVTFSGRFPTRLAGEIPLRESLRVDRTDVTSVGEETTPPGGGDEP